MASAIPPVKGAAFSFELSLVSQADTDVFKDNPTLAAGDVTVVKDGVLDGNIDTLPTAVTSLTRVLTVALSAAEMTADRVTVLFHDAAGDEWQDAVITIYTAAQTLDATDVVADALVTELAKVPKSDSTVTWNATALASVATQVGVGLNAAIPGSPTADSMYQRVKAIDDLTQAGGAGDLAAILTDTAAIVPPPIVL